MAGDPFSTLAQALDTIAPHNLLAALLSGGKWKEWPEPTEVEVLSTVSSQPRAVFEEPPTKEEIRAIRTTQMEKNIKTPQIVRHLILDYEGNEVLDEFGAPTYELYQLEAPGMEPSFTSHWSRHPVVGSRFSHGTGGGTELTRKQRGLTKGLGNALNDTFSPEEQTERVQSPKKEGYITSGMGSARKREGQAARTRPYPSRIGTNMF